MTGIALVAALKLGIYWLCLMAFFPTYYDGVMAFCQHGFMRLMWGGLMWAAYYHWLNGLRHLAWDVGLGFTLKTIHQTGWLVVVASFVLTALTLYLW
jgi:succinate dehydrogenase / fumarate reductase cytochrome b subunit